MLITNQSDIFTATPNSTRKVAENDPGRYSAHGVNWRQLSYWQKREIAMFVKHLAYVEQEMLRYHNTEIYQNGKVVVNFSLGIDFDIYIIKTQEK